MFIRVDEYIDQLASGMGGIFPGPTLLFIGIAKTAIPTPASPGTCLNHRGGWPVFLHFAGSSSLITAEIISFFTSILIRWAIHLKNIYE